MFCMRPSPSSCWFINQISAWALKYCMRFEDLGLVVCTTKSLFGCFRLRTTNYYDLFTGNPTNVVFQRETVAMRAQVRHCPTGAMVRRR